MLESALVTAPMLTVLCSTYASARYLPRTLATLADQTDRRVQLLFTDDGSTDGTVDLLHAWSAEQRPRWGAIEVLANPHGGPGANRNAGLAAASGDWIAFLDGDDVWAPQKIARVREAIARDPRANLVVHRETHRRLDGTEPVLTRIVGHDGDLAARLLSGALLLHLSAVTCRRDLIAESGGFDPTLVVGEDLDLCLRMSAKLRCRVIPDVLGSYVEEPTSVTHLPYGRRFPSMMRVVWRHRAASRSRAAYRMLRTVCSRQWVAAPATHSR